jgi:hypothetical protein
MTETEVRKLVREELLREQNTLNSNYLQRVIFDVLEDWSEELTAAETEALEFFRHRLDQSYPGKEVTREDLAQLLRRPDARNINLDRAEQEELIDIIWNA